LRLIECAGSGGSVFSADWSECRVYDCRARKQEAQNAPAQNKPNAIPESLLDTKVTE
jgi:hypothetical protein